MATPAEFGGLAALYLPGVPRSLTAIHGGLQYTGEVVLLDQWDPEWGRSLEGDVYFRVVLLRSRRQLPRGAVHDSRMAACVPGRRSPRGRSEVGRELTAIRETQATYRTLRDPQDSPVRGYLERQREELEGRLLAEEASLYASGYVESPTGFSKDLGGYFADPEPTRWFQGLAETLLSWAYPSLPLDSALLPRPLESQEIPRICEALFARSASERAALGEFGPGLGLSKPEAPLEFDPGACRVFQEVRASLESRGGELPWEGVRSLLAHAVGLIRPLATLYLLAFVHYGRPETELSLVQGHGLALRGGRPVRGARLSREFLPSLTWPAEPGDQDARFDQSFNSIRLLGEELSWNDALQYTSLLCQGLAEVEQDLEVAGQERELLGALQELSGDADQALATLARLGEAAAGPSGRDLHSSLQRLQGVCEGRDFRQVHLVARTTYGDPRELLEDLDLLRRLLHLGESLERIVGMKTYLDDGAVVARNEQLSVDRMALMEEMSLGALLASSQGWPTLRARSPGLPAAVPPRLPASPRGLSEYGCPGLGVVGGLSPEIERPGPS